MHRQPSLSFLKPFIMSIIGLLQNFIRFVLPVPASVFVVGEEERSSAQSNITSVYL